MEANSVKFFSVLNTDTGQWEVTSYDGTITIETESKTAAEWIEYLVDEIDGVENLIGTGVISNGD